jgi:hypothetical protein
VEGAAAEGAASAAALPDAAGLSAHWTPDPAPAAPPKRSMKGLLAKRMLAAAQADEAYVAPAPTAASSFLAMVKQARPTR